MSINGQWIKKMWYLYGVEYYSVIRRNEIGSFVEMQMNLVCRTEGSKSEREKQILHINRYMWNLEEWYRWTYQQEGTEMQTETMGLWTQGGNEREG